MSFNSRYGPSPSPLFYSIILHNHLHNVKVRKYSLNGWEILFFKILQFLYSDDNEENWTWSLCITTKHVPEKVILKKWSWLEKWLLKWDASSLCVIRMKWPFGIGTPLLKEADTYLARFRSESFDGSYGDSFDGISRIVGIGAVCDSITCRAISA